MRLIILCGYFLINFCFCGFVFVVSCLVLIIAHDSLKLTNRNILKWRISCIHPSFNLSHFAINFDKKRHRHLFNSFSDSEDLNLESKSVRVLFAMGYILSKCVVFYSRHCESCGVLQEAGYYVTHQSKWANNLILLQHKCNFQCHFQFHVDSLAWKHKLRLILFFVELLWLHFQSLLCMLN